MMAAQEADPALDILRSLKTSEDTKAAAWDVFQVQDKSTFEKRLRAIKLPEEVKAKLWDAKWKTADSRIKPDNTTKKESSVDRPSALGRFTSEATQSAIVEPVKGLYGLGTTLFTEGVRSAATQAVHGVLDPTLQHLTKATEARRAGKYGEWVSNMLRAVPIIGPVGERVGEELQRGDVAGAAGRAIGTAATFAGPKALARVAPSRGVRSAVPLTRAERTGSRMSAFLEALTERTAPGSGVFQRFRLEQQQALQRAAETAASRVGRSQSAPELGSLVQRELEHGQVQATQRAGALYELIDEKVRTQTRRVATTTDVPSKIVGPSGEPLTVPQRRMQKIEVGGVQPKTLVLREAAIPILKRLRAESKLLPPQELSRTSALLERIIRAPKTLPFSAFQDARSDLLRIVRSIGDPIPGKAGGVAKRLAKSTDQAMMDAADASGIPGLTGLVRQANTMWSDAKNLYNSTFIKRLKDASPETLAAVVRAADIDDLGLLQSAVSTETLQGVKARIMRDVIEGATTRTPAPSSRGLFAHPLQETGVTLEGRTPLPVEEALSGQSIRRELKRLGPAKTEFLFGSQAVASLDAIADLAERVGQQSGGMVPGLLAGGVNATIFAPVLRPLGIEATTLPVSIGTAAGFNLLARVLTSPQGLTNYRQFLRALSERNRPLALAAGLRLSAMMDSDQAQVDAKKQSNAATAR